MASSIKYGFFPTWYYITYPTVWAGYKVPIYASSYMYNQCPPPEDPDRTYAEGDERGYDSVAAFYKEVCDKLQFNPFTVTTMYMTTLATEDEEMVNVINSFTGHFEGRDGSYNGYNPEPSGTGSDPDDLVGYCDLSTGVRGTTGFTGSGFNGVTANFLSRYMHWTKYTSNDGVMFEFHIWPTTAIESGTIDLSRLFKDGANYRILKLQLLIYKHDDKYYWSIELHNQTLTNTETQWYDEHLDGYELDHIYEPDNPYDDHQPDGNEGGDGGFDKDSDPTPIPDLPSVDITSLGGIKLYKCLPSDLATIFNYLGSNDPGDAVLKWFNNPIQGMTACYFLPYPVTTTNNSTPVTILGAPTGAVASLAAQWQEWNMGSVYVDYSCGNCFLDFEPYSTCSIYLPFVGIRRLNMDEVVGKTVGVTYQFDNTSGACVVYVTVGGSVKYSYSGSCAVGIPISQSNWGQTYMAAATAAAGALAGGIGAVAGAASAGGGLAGAKAAGSALSQGIQAGGGLSSLNAKPTISRSGSICGAASALGYPAPYLIIEYPDKAKVANPAPVTGLACGRTLSLGSLSGYNVIEHVHLDNIGATGPELEEIERLLYEGVIF